MNSTSFADVPFRPGESPRLMAHEKARCRAAAAQARRVLPEPLGELVARELDAYADFGHRFDTSGLMPRTVLAILGRPSPTSSAPPRARAPSRPVPARPSPVIRKRVRTRPAKVTGVRTGPFFRGR